MIAHSVAKSTRAPQLAPHITAPPASAPPGIQPVVQTACAFGNSLTMPLLYLLTLFPGAAEAATVTGFTALILLGWSPLFWTFGVHKLASVHEPGGSTFDGSSSALARWSGYVPLGPASPGPSRGTNGTGSSNGTVLTIDSTPSTSGGDGASLAGAENAPGSNGSQALPADMADLPPAFPADDANSRWADLASSSSTAGSRDMCSASDTCGDEAGVAPSERLAMVPANSAAAGGEGQLVHAPRRARGMYMTPVSDPSIKPTIKLPLLSRKAGADGASHSHSWRSRLMARIGKQVGGTQQRRRRWVEQARRIANPPIVAAAIGVALGRCPLGVLPPLTHGKHPSACNTCLVWKGLPMPLQL
jgi:hypothetical protein